MKSVLILGGTNFIGRNLVERFLELDEFEITLFNRQLTQTNLFPSVKKIKGDRETDDIKQIQQQDWDYVVDLSGFYPKVMSEAIDLLNKVKRYVFISSCSVYDNKNNKTLLRNEQAEILACDADQKVDRTDESYGNRKAECERVLIKSGLPYAILRPALVYGKYDPTDRLYYWLHQVKKHSQLLLPENGNRVFSTTYVSDLVETIIQSLDADGESETYNVITTPETSITKVIELANSQLKSDLSFIEASADFLNKNNINQWVDIPLWLNADYYTYSNQKLKNQLGIEPTKIKVGIEKTIEYFNQLNWPAAKSGISEDARQELLKKLNS